MADGVGGADAFEAFVAAHARRIWQAVVPLVGTDVASDATSDALAYAWEHWARVGAMANAAGYVYTVARTHGVRRAQRGLRAAAAVDAAGAPLPAPEPVELPEIEPALARALGALSEQQRQAVVLVDAFGWGLTESAELLGVSVSTLRNHRARGMARLRAELKVDDDG
jgi:RNA polymerase sigma-70 factor (ECF subfamily)